MGNFPNSPDFLMRSCFLVKKMEHSLGQHDVGGQEVLVPLDLKEQPVTLWEKQVRHNIF